MTEYKKITRTEMRKSFLYIGIFIAIIGASSILLFTSYWYLWIVLLVICVGLLMILVIQQKEMVYKCPKCRQEFEISGLKHVIAPHGISKSDGEWYEWKSLECPICHGKAKMFPIEGRK